MPRVVGFDRALAVPTAAATSAQNKEFALHAHKHSFLKCLLDPGSQSLDTCAVEYSTGRFHAVNWAFYADDTGDEISELRAIDEMHFDVAEGER